MNGINTYQDEILVVDDSSANLKLLEDILGNAGYRVRLANDGELALRSARIQPPALVLLDIRMPGMDGYEVCRRLKDDEKTRSIPVIFLSILEDEREKVKAFQSGGVDYINKPIHPEEVFARVNTHLALRHAQLALERRNAELEAAHETLEERVRERSSELEQVNHTLREEINRHIQTLKALRESEARYRRIVDTANEGVWVIEPDSQTVSVNGRMAEMLGYTPEEIIGRLFTDFMFEEDIPDHLRQIENRRQGIGGQYERRLRHRDGRTVWTLASAAPLLDEQRRFEGSFAMFTDITERKLAEEALAHLAAIVESSDDAITGKSPEGIILSWNRGAERLYGYRKEEVMGRSISILIPDDHAEKMLFILDHVKRGEPLEHYETVRLRKDGSRVEVSVTVSPICDAGGKIVGASTIARDITERRKAELKLQKLNEELELRVIERTTDLNKSSKELLESQQALMNIVEDLNEKTTELEQANSRLQELDRLKSMFIASMSHELRTPLNSVIGFSSVLLNEWVGPINAEQKENLAIILRSGKHLLNLINDVIDVSKIEAGKIESIPEEFDLHDLILEAASLVKKELGEKGLVLQITSPFLLLFTDRRRLLQCVLNLLSNAVKFTEQGSVTVETRIVQRPGETPEAGVVEISVTDTGIGIREEDIGKMFQPFVRLFSPLQATVPGTGLGLYLTRKLAAEILNGDILLTSEYGKGSRFTIRIPVGAS